MINRTDQLWACVKFIAFQGTHRHVRNKNLKKLNKTKTAVDQIITVFTPLPTATGFLSGQYDIRNNFHDDNVRDKIAKYHFLHKSQLKFLLETDVVQ